MDRSAGEEFVVAAPKTNIEQPEEWVEPSDLQAEEELSIGRRLESWKTIASFGLAFGVIAVVVVKGGIDPASLWQRLRTLNIFLFGAAFLVYYTTFPLRGARWKVLLQNAYSRTHSETVDSMSVRGLSEIVYISWFVNCVIPAKLGDLYRAYLVKLWKHVSWSKTVGTVLAERLIDILILSLLLAGTGFIVFHSKLGHISIILLFGVGLAVAGIIGLLLMKTLSGWLSRVLPERIVHKYRAFEEGTLQSFRRIPLLIALTAVIWLLEGARLQLVFASLGLNNHLSTIPFAPLLFLALGTAVLTTVPFTPGGLGLVEIGLGSLMIYLGMPKEDAVAVVVVDRLLSYYSVAFFGFLVYLLSKRSHFRHPA